MVTGGTTVMPGLLSRLESDLNKCAVKLGVNNILQVYSDSHRQFAAWIGASILSSFSTFGQFIVTKQQYEENGGASLILKKAI